MDGDDTNASTDRVKADNSTRVLSDIFILLCSWIQLEKGSICLNGLAVSCC